VIRPNPALANEGAYTEKAHRAKAAWPELTVVPWTVPSREERSAARGIDRS
jgi:hypothetical protein